MKQIKWLDYLYANRRSELFDIIRSYNLPIPSDMSELYECINYLIEREGDAVEEKLLKIHPEYDGISKLVAKQHEKLNAVHSIGYHNFVGEEKTNVVGGNVTLSDVQNLIALERSKTIQNVLLISVGVLFILKFFKKND